MIIEINESMVDTKPYYLIKTDEGLAYLQRKTITSATEKQLSISENIIIGLCVHILKMDKK